MNNTANSKPGPESKITVPLVKRVSALVAQGIPIRQALAGEPVTQAAYERHLRRHPELAKIQETAKTQFLKKTFGMILSRPGPLVKWLLQRRHPQIFGSPPPDPATPTSVPASPNQIPSQTQTQTPIQTIAGVPEHLVEEGRKNDQKL